MARFSASGVIMFPKASECMFISHPEEEKGDEEEEEYRNIPITATEAQPTFIIHPRNKESDERRGERGGFFCSYCWSS